MLTAWFNRQSIRLRIFIPFLLISLITSFLFTVYGFMQSNAAIVHEIDRRLLISALTMKLILPEDYFERVTGPGSIPETEHWHHTKNLETFLRHVGAKYLYALHRRDGRYYFVASADMTEPFWSEYRNPAPNIAEVEALNAVHISTTADPDYGLLRSVVLPHRDREGRRFIIGADIEASEVALLKRRAFLNFLTMGAISFGLAVLFSYLVSATITRPLALLSAFTRRLCAGGFSADIRLDPALIPDRADTGSENALLARDIHHMQDALADHIRQLEITRSAREQAESELRIAGQIQTTFLPPAWHPGRGGAAWDLAAFMKTAKQAGGDLYDYFALDGDRLCLAIGDVSGKGMPAALFMAITVALLRAAAKTVPDPVAIMSKINADIADRNDSCTFVTLFVGILNLRTGVLEYCNGGHNPARLKRADGTVLPMPVSANCVVGVMEKARFVSERMTLHPGELLLFYTDGVTEAVSADGGMFGEARLDQFLADLPMETPTEQVARGLTACLDAFADGCEQADDITLLALRWRQPERQP